MCDIKYEIDFVKEFLLEDENMKWAYGEYDKSEYSFSDTIDQLLDYCFYSDFNPYLDKKYLDYTWLCDNNTGKIYNLDDIYEVYIDNLKEL